MPRRTLLDRAGEFLREWSVPRQLAGADHARGAAESAMARASRPRTEMADRVSTSVCPYCAVGCAQLVDAKGGKPIAVEGDPASPINQGTLCPKGAATLGLLTSPQRLSRVLHRAPGATGWREVGLDSAMARIARLTKDTRDRGFVAKAPDGTVLKRTWSGRRWTEAQVRDRPAATASRTGANCAVTFHRRWWQDRQTSPAGVPACASRAAPAWQNPQSRPSPPAWIAWLKGRGCGAGLPTAQAAPARGQAWSSARARAPSSAATTRPRRRRASARGEKSCAMGPPPGNAPDAGGLAPPRRRVYPGGKGDGRGRACCR